MDLILILVYYLYYYRYIIKLILNTMVTVTLMSQYNNNSSSAFLCILYHFRERGPGYEATESYYPGRPTWLNHNYAKDSSRIARDRKCVYYVHEVNFVCIRHYVILSPCAY